MIILLVGEKGSGKTTTAMNLARRLIQAGIQVGGVICPGIFEQNRKVGMKNHYPGTGYEEISGWEISLAGIPVPKPTGPETFSYGRWEFSSSALATADAVIIEDIEACPLVFVDEIGPLELDHGLGLCRTLARLDDEQDGNTCIKLVCGRQDLAQTLAKRWPAARLVQLPMGEQAFIDRAEETILTVVIAEMATTGCRMKINPDLATVGFTSSSPSAPDDAQT